MSILGPGADVLTVDGGGTAGYADGRQIFYFDSVASGTNVVSGLTLTGGYLSGYGGAIGLDGGGSSLEVIDMVITGNEAELLRRRRLVQRLLRDASHLGLTHLR